MANASLKKNQLKNLLGGLILLFSFSAHAEFFIINTQSLDPAEFSQNAGRSSLSDVEASKTALLQYYQYPERAAAVQQRRQILDHIAAQLPSLLQNGASEAVIGELNAYVRQAEPQIKQSLAFLADFELAELKQLYELEQRNDTQLQRLKAEIGRIKVVEAAPQPLWNSDPAPQPAAGSQPATGAP